VTDETEPTESDDRAARDGDDGNYAFMWRFLGDDPRDKRILELVEEARRIAPFRPSRRGVLWQAIWVGLPILLADYNEAKGLDDPAQ